MGLGIASRGFHSISVQRSMSVLPIAGSRPGREQVRFGADAGVGPITAVVAVCL